MVASGSRTMLAGSLSSCIAGFLLSCRFSQSFGPRRSCIGTGPVFVATGVGNRTRGEGAADRNGTAGVDPADEHGESALGCATHSRRTAQAWVQCRSINRREWDGPAVLPVVFAKESPRSIPQSPYFIGDSKSAIATNARDLQESTPAIAS